MEELKSARNETEKTRQDTGAVTVLPGEVEGMQDPHSAGKSRAMEKRKRELEERRKMVDAKRRKVTSGQDNSSAASPPVVEAQTSVFTAVAPDPFATLEVASVTAPKAHNGKGKAVSTEDEANLFLAQLQQDFLGGKRK
jgi:hypothetical protein